jgi:ABC-type spermidine/putrescine transport system permease subunit II
VIDLVTRLAHAFAVAVIALFLLGPIVLVLVLSFSNDTFISFPPESWGVREYRTMLQSPLWSAPIQHSLAIASVVALLVALIGSCAVIAMARTRIPGRRLLLAIAIGPLVVPGVVYAIGAYETFNDLGLAGSRAAFVLAHAVLATPLFLIVASAAITRVPRDLELAAMSLGAGRTRALTDVTLRLMAPAIVAGAVLAFSLSLNEVVVSSFLADASFTTLPVAIYASLRIAVDPVVMAISATLAACAALATAVVLLLRHWTR